MRIIKRLGDLTLASILLLAAVPLLLLVAIVVLAAMGRPVLFRQTRLGQGMKPFLLLKFRTMRITGAEDPATDEARLTRAGRWLRASSLDELPELWNVVKGEMSFVGPRPLLVQYQGRYSPEQARRHDVLPGLTGWAQVNGRNAISWEQRFAYDLWYVDNQSLWLDVRILCLTVWRLFDPRHVSAAGSTPMPEFMGNPFEESADSTPPRPDQGEQADQRKW